MTDLAAALELAHTACDEADGIALRSFRRDLHIEAKPDRSLVTQADREIEERVRTRIAEAFPDDGLVGEEFGEQSSGSSRRWFIDPIDGTHNFVRGIPLFGTLLALEVAGDLVLGVMSAPALGTRWYATRGMGAWAVTLPRAPGEDGARRLRASGVTRLEDAQLLYSSVPELIRSDRVPGFERLIGRVWRDRGFGDFWGYALVAEGAAEAMVEIGVNSWDLAAPLVVLEEAGGRLTDLDGERTIHNRSVLATNGVLHEALLTELRRPSA
jgi:histidinol-phosphatase